MLEFLSNFVSNFLCFFALCMYMYINTCRSHDYHVISPQVALIGYPGRHRDITQYPDEFRVILFDGLIGRSFLKPSINVFFTKKLWNVGVSVGVVMWVWSYI